MPRKHWRLRQKPTDQYCAGVRFDTSQMDQIEFERLLLWERMFPKWFTKSHEAELTAEIYRRAAQVRARRPRFNVTPTEEQQGA